MHLVHMLHCIATWISIYQISPSTLNRKKQSLFMVTYQFQLINPNNGISDVLKRLESNRSSPGQACWLFVSWDSNKDTCSDVMSTVSQDSRSNNLLSFECDWRIVNCLISIFFFQGSLKFVWMLDLKWLRGACCLKRESDISLTILSLLVCCYVNEHCARPFQWYWKELTIGLIWLHALAKSSLLRSLTCLEEAS